MNKTKWFLIFVAISFLVASWAYAQDCTICHPLVGDPPQPEIITDCVDSRCHATYDNGNHHTTAEAFAGMCTACHDPNLVADYDEENPSSSEPTELTPTVQSCNNCHKGHLNPLDQNGDPYPFPIYNTEVLEHMDGQGHVTACTFCHAPEEPYPIRQCETCHTVETLHNIAGHAVISPNPLPYDGYWYDENGDWTEITGNDRCIACHGIPPDPAPDTMVYVSQDVGTYDTTYSELTEADCRGCHGESLAERHHQVPFIARVSPSQQEPTIYRSYEAAYLSAALGYTITGPRWGRVAINGDNFGPERLAGDQVRIGDPRTVAPIELQYDTDGDPYTVENIFGGVSLYMGPWSDDIIGGYLYPEPGQYLYALYGPNVGLHWLDTYLGMWVVKDYGGQPVASNVEPIRIITPLPD